MRYTTFINAMMINLTLASSALAAAPLHQGGDVFHVDSSAVSTIDYAQHYGHLFDQLDVNQDGLLQAAEVNNINRVDLGSGGYQQHTGSINTSDKTLTKNEFVMLQNVKPNRKPDNMAEIANPQGWLSRQTGNS